VTNEGLEYLIDGIEPHSESLQAIHIRAAGCEYITDNGVLVLSKKLRKFAGLEKLCLYFAM